MKKNGLLIILTIFLCSCLQGTDTGNPGLTDTVEGIEGGIISGDDPSDTNLNEIDALILATCNLLTDCENVDFSDCFDAILDQSNIDEEIGLSVGQFTDLRETRAASADGSLSKSADAQKQCVEDIESLSCSQPNVDNSYDDNLSNAYENVADMLPSSCNGIYSSP